MRALFPSFYHFTIVRPQRKNTFLAFFSDGIKWREIIIYVLSHLESFCVVKLPDSVFAFFTMNPLE